MINQIVRLIVVMTITIFSFAVIELPKAFAATYNGEFISFSYENNKPTTVTILDKNNRRVRHNLSDTVSFSMNGRSTNENSFKKGLTVQLVKNGKFVTEIKGIEEVMVGELPSTNYQISGVVTKIDPNGMYITVKPDNQKEQNYFINRNTRFLKNSSIADLSMLYEGDRVKIKMPSAQVSTLAEIEIMNSGVIVENIYKGTLKSSDAYRNSITVSNAQAFENWMFGSSITNELATFTFGTDTTVFAGNVAIKKEDLRYYVNKEVYFVTVTQFSREVIQKIVILQDNERTYYDDFKAINTNYNYLSLNRAGNIYYHKGSILIRNGRLVEPNSLTSYGTAFIITDGQTRGNFAHVVNVTNDGFNSPNFANHELYFGELAFVDTDNYLIEVSNAVKLTNNYWQSSRKQTFAFSNGTNANLNYNSQVIRLIPNMDLWDYESSYGYFYVKDGHIQAIHLLDASQEKTSRVLTGSVSTVNNASPTMISIRNVSQWLNGGWIESNAVQNIDLSQTMVVKNGKIIEATQIKPSDRVVLLTTPSLNTHVLLINE